MITRAKKGMRFGRLLVSEEAEPRVLKNGRKLREVRCECDCGGSLKVKVDNLYDGTKSCGCLHKETITKHGLHGHKLYSTWGEMMRRCYNKESKDYERYGGRGIRVCERWQDINNFIEDVGVRPSKQHSIDRVDNEGDYCKENCRWATAKEQSNNTRRNRNLIYKGETKTMMQWAEQFGLRHDTLWRRIDSGWSVITALEKPVKN